MEIYIFRLKRSTQIVLDLLQNQLQSVLVLTKYNYIVSAHTTWYFMGKSAWHMWCTPTKQGTSDILGKTRWVFGIIVRSTLSALIWNRNLIHTPTFWLFEIWPFVYETSSSFSGSVILRNWPIKFPIPMALDMAGCRKCSIFCGKMFENQSAITRRWQKTY